MADQATSSANPQTPPEGAPAGGDAATVPPAGGTSAPTAGTDIAAAGADPPAEPATPGFGERGRMRRRLRFLRKARELAYRDLGGLVFEMQRLGERRDELVAAKLATLAAIDAEVRALEQALGDSRAVTVLREAGIAACPRCAAIHGSEDHFCPSCGLAMGRHADRPIAVAPAAAMPPSVAMPPAQSPAAKPHAAEAPQTEPPTATPSATQPPAAQPTTTTPAPPAPLPPTRPAPRVPTPYTTPPRSPTPQRASDDRPTEIIRPSDGPPGGNA